MTRVNISPDILLWARDRARIKHEDLLSRFPKLSEWEDGSVSPTLKQLEKFAKAVHVPFGYLFLETPPKETLPIPDFRTINNQKINNVSPNLLDVLYNCQERQGWYKDFSLKTRQKKLDFIGRANISMSPEDVASDIKKTIGFDIETRSTCRTWEDALRFFIQKADEAGVLVMVNGVVLSNNNRKLDPQEFRGFALSDKLAPLIFINGADSKSAQMFTLAHELAHLWLNSSGVSNASAKPLDGFPKEEVWCNAVAAELLVPMAMLNSLINDIDDLDILVARLTRYFKVSTLVILRRLLDAGRLNSNEFQYEWSKELERLREIANGKSGGGDFYRTTISRVSRRFTQSLVVSVLEGQTLYRDAFRMLGVSKTETFNNLGREVGIPL